jgi:hypothetical protein
MERLLARLERRFGAYAVENLILYLVGGMALVWVLSEARPFVIGRLTLDMNAVRHGQVWRLVTFLFIPPSRSAYWILINLYFTWWVGSSLEQLWGAFKLNVFVLLGALATIAAAAVAGPTSNAWLLGVDGTLILALATLSPTVEIFLMFVVRIPLKWIGILAAGLAAYQFANGDWSVRAPILAAGAVYALFFAEHWAAFFRGRRVIARQAARRVQLESGAHSRSMGPRSMGQRACAICGAKEADGADIRVCSCEKCGGQPRSLCLAHARNH